MPYCCTKIYNKSTKFNYYPQLVWIKTRPHYKASTYIDKFIQMQAALVIRGLFICEFAYSH